MKTSKELNTDILNITMKINDKHPELSKYVCEIPVRLSETEGSEADLQNLKDYHSSLLALLKKYDISHSDDSSANS